MTSALLKKCAECGCDFSAKAWNAKFCGTLCKAKLNSRAYYSKHREKCLDKKKEYYLDNRREIIKKNSTYCDNRRKIDVDFRIKRHLRNRLYKALKGDYKTGSAIESLGCSIAELKQHLESKFQSNMSWDNYGKWHIDHIVPLDSFALSNLEQIKSACHYSNLQPLWSQDNIRKSNK